MKIVNPIRAVLVHDEQKEGATTDVDIYLQHPATVKEVIIAAGAESTLVTFNLTCFQPTIIEAFVALLYTINFALTFRLYIDGTIVATVALTNTAAADYLLSTLKGYRSVSGGARTVKATLYNSDVGQHEGYVKCRLFASCLKT